MPRPAGPVRRRARAVVTVVAVAVASTVVTASGPAVPGAVAASVAPGVVAPAAAAGAVRRVPPVARPTSPVAVQLLALNDFHGHLEPPGGDTGTIDGVPAGGVEFLATQLALLSDQVQAGNTITVAAGDLIGASPLLSAAFHDEPAVEALGSAGLDLASVGNHEFDEGAAELLRIQNGGCHPVDGCADPTRPYTGSAFQYLSANAFVTATGAPLLPPFAIEEVAGVRVGFIGMTLEETPAFVTPSGVVGLDFHDEILTSDWYAGRLRAQGVEAIVLLLHEGGTQAPGGGINDCAGLRGPIVPIAEGLSDAIDVVVSGHTHQAYNCVIDGKIVTSAGSNGRLVTDIDLQIDPVGGDVLAASARNVVVGREVPPDPRQTELIARYRALLGPAGAPRVGTAASAISRTQEPLIGAQRGESELGDLLADAQLAATDTEQGAVAAFVHPGAVRADVEAGPVMAEEAFTVQPYNGYLTTLDLTGAQLDCLLEQQFVTGQTLQPSATVTYTVEQAGVPGTADNPCSGTRVTGLAVGGAPVDPAATYRITVADFLADGADGFTVLTLGTNRVVGALDIEAFAGYLTAAGPVGAPATDRIAVR